MSCSNIPEEAIGTEPAEETLMPRKKKVKGICVKCRTAKGQIVRLSITYCQKCFYNATYLRFAKSINLGITGPNPTRSTPVNPLSTQPKSNNAHLPKTPTPGRPPMQEGDVLVALSGGAGSLSMVDLLMGNRFVGDPAGLSEGQGKQQAGGGGSGGTRVIKRFTWRFCYAVHVDFSDVLGKVHDQTAQLRSLVDSYNTNASDSSNVIAFVPLKIQDVYDDRIPGWLNGMQKEKRSLSRLDEGEQQAKAGLKVDLGRADIPIVSTSPTSSSSNALAKLRSLLSTLPSSSHPHLLQTLLQKLLQTAAHNLPNVSHVLLGDTSTRQAVSIISGTAVGRGWTLGTELALSGPLLDLAPPAHVTDEAELARIKRIKPMRDIMVKEAAYHCHTRGIQSYNFRGWDTFEDSGSSSTGARNVAGEARGKGGIRSLEKLTEDFIFSLDVDHPSTVSTITRTGSKLTFKGYSGAEGQPKGKQWGVCPFCGCPEEPSALEWKARTALTSLGRPEAGSTRADPSEQAFKADEAVKLTMHSGQDNAAPNPDQADEFYSLAEQMCYACLTAFSNGTSGLKKKGDDGSETFEVELPYWVTQRMRGHGEHEEQGELVVTGKMGRDAMKASIGEFLLADEDE